MLSTVKTLKNDEFFRVFAIFLAKTGDFYYGKKDFNFMLSFCHFGAKTGLEPLLILCCLFAILEQKQDLNLYTIYI